MNVTTSFDVWALGRLIDVKDTAESRIALESLGVQVLDSTRHPRTLNNVAEGFWSAFLPRVKWEYADTRIVMHNPIATIFAPARTQRNLINAESWDNFRSVWDDGRDIDLTIFAADKAPVFDLLAFIKPGWTITLVRPSSKYELLMKGDRWEDRCIDPLMTELCQKFNIVQVANIQGPVEVESFGVEGPKVSSIKQ